MDGDNANRNSEQRVLIVSEISKKSQVEWGVEKSRQVDLRVVSIRMVTEAIGRGEPPRRETKSELNLAR